MTNAKQIPISKQVNKTPITSTPKQEQIKTCEEYVVSKLLETERTMSSFYTQLNTARKDLTLEQQYSKKLEDDLKFITSLFTVEEDGCIKLKDSFIFTSSPDNAKLKTLLDEYEHYGEEKQ